MRAPAPPLKLVLVEGQRATNPWGLQEWFLKFRSADDQADERRLQRVHVHGVAPHRLLGLRLTCRSTVAFDLQTAVSDMGRSCTAGDMLLALYGAGDQGEIHLPAADFAHSVHPGHADVYIRVQVPEPASIEGIEVVFHLE